MQRTRIGPYGLLLAGLLCSPPPAAAQAVRGTFDVQLTGAEEVRAGEAVSSFPVLGHLAIQVGRLGVPGLDTARLVFQGWLKHQLGDDELRDERGDISLLYVDGRIGILSFRVGRQHIARGVGRMAMIDGADARVEITDFLSAQAFFGGVVHRELDFERGDWHTGGRLATHFTGPSEIGLSYAHLRDDGEIAREEVALDGYSVIGPVRLLGFGALSPRVARLAEARLAATVQATDDLTLTLDAERVYPDLRLPRSSIFSVFSDAAHDSFGLDARWTPSVYWTLTLDGALLRLDAEQLGYSAGARAITFREANHRSFVGLELRRLDEADNGYLRGRALTGLQLLDPLRVTADAWVTHLDESINDESTSVLGQANLVYEFGSSFQLVGSVTGGTTPQATSQIEGMLRFGYGYNVDFGSEARP